MNDDISIRVEKLGKLYRIGEREPYKTLRDSLARSLRAFSRKPRSGSPEDPYIWALKEVSFDIRRGEVVGIIGPNAAGKSTLLKIVSRITEPTEGYAEVRGRVGSLLEVGTGFHPELTGRENIYLNGAILGMKKLEIDRKLDDIVTFAGIGKFLDTPVKYYSSGMYVRVAFAVAAHLEPEILLVDEVLAVGDAEFQRKCLGKMRAVATQGRTVLFVSHNLQAIQSLCQRGLLLERGKLVYDGAASRACERYLESIEPLASAKVELDSHMGREGDGQVRITKLEIIDADTGMPTPRLPSGRGFVVHLHFHAREAISFPKFAFTLFTAAGSRVFNTMSTDSGLETKQIAGSGVAELRVSSITLSPGPYVCNLAVTDRVGHYYDHVRGVPCFDVDPSQLLPKTRLYTQSDGAIFTYADWHIRCESVSRSDETLKP